MLCELYALNYGYCTLMTSRGFCIIPKVWEYHHFSKYSGDCTFRDINSNISIFLGQVAQNDLCDQFSQLLTHNEKYRHGLE